MRIVTGTTAGSLRQPDVLARFGGEELIVFLPHTDLLGAVDVAERIRNIGQTPSPAGAEEFGRMMRADFERWQRVVKASGAKAQ